MLKKNMLLVVLSAVVISGNVFADGTELLGEKKLFSNVKDIYGNSGFNYSGLEVDCASLSNPTERRVQSDTVDSRRARGKRASGRAE